MAKDVRRVVFTRTYNHRWPSRAVTEFPASPRARTVKPEVARAAIARGYAEEASHEQRARAPRLMDGCDIGSSQPDPSGDAHDGGEVPGVSTGADGGE